MSDKLFSGLRALAESAFPKRCNTCGATFASAEEFIRETRRVSPTHSGLKQSIDDDSTVIVEVFRNCPCGSTLVNVFADRRDTSEAGVRRREKFGKLVDQLMARGWTREKAREELLTVLRGERSEAIEQLMLASARRRR